jgi:hypothetical protein
MVFSRTEARHGTSMVISIMLDMGLSFERPGKTNSLPAVSRFALPNSSIQQGAKGTLCSLLAFCAA